MARINARPSYRSNVSSSRLTSATPTPGPAGDSDQENHEPNVARIDKGKQRAGDPPRRPSLPTPNSDDTNGSRGQKRKRNGRNSNEDESEEHDDEQDELDKEFTRYFDPNQDPEIRRGIKRKSRALERAFQEQRDDLMRDRGDGLSRTVNEANKIYKTVKQTNDATLDSRLLVNVSDLANKKTAQLVLGDSSTGIDVDEFLSKCISFMRNGGPQDDDAPSTARRRRRTHHPYEDDDDDAAGEALDWEVFGRHACFPFNSRPCVPSFLLGPLSVEKKTRTQTQRRARQSKDTVGREARPEALTRADLSQSDENGLTAICTRIRTHLASHVKKAEDILERAGFDSGESLQTHRGKLMMRKCRISDTGGVPLFEYVINPRSFGQTVENLFYVSFLIKEASVGIQHDSDGLPTIILSSPTDVNDQREKNMMKHQAVLSLDYGTWQKLIDAFDIKDSMIPHRQEESATQVEQRGWYT